MDKFSKKTLLSMIGGAGIYGAAAGSQTVKFAYTENIAKVGTAAEGTITFYADTTNKTGIIAVGGDIVSSKILNVTSAAVDGGKTGENLITVTYFANGATATTTFEVVNAAAAKAYFEDYFTNSDTITITDGTADVNVDGQTILIDSANKYLKSGLNIAYIAEAGTTGATIALRDNSNNVLSSIEVSDIVGDGVLKDSIYHQDTNILELRFGNGKVYDADDPTTYTAVEVNLQKLIDINDVFIGNDSSIYLNATLDASTVTLDTKMQDPSTADATHTGLADALKVKQYVDSKSSDLAVTASGDQWVSASVDAQTDNKHVNVAATAKTQTAVALAETAVQSVVEGTSVEGYVALNVSAKSDASVITITTDDSALSAKITEIDGSIGDISTRLANKTADIDASIDRLDTSVSGIEAQIAAMDADISTAVALDAANGIYVRGTLTEADGVVTSIGLTSKIADTSITRYNKAGDIDPAWELNEDGLLNGDAATKIKTYVDDVAAQLRDEAGAVDSSKSDADSANFISIHEEQEDGEITVFTVDSSYGTYVYTAGTHTFGTPTDGLAKVADTQTFVQNVIESLDLVATASDASAADASNFVKTTISETDGIVKNESVEVTYATVTAAPGDITVSQNGIVKGDVLEAAIEGALTWTVLS